MTSRDYRAAVRLTSRAGAVLAEAGEACTRVPAASLGWLAAQGLIVPIDTAPAAGSADRAAVVEPPVEVD